jgi:glycogen debranching enzyme
LTAGRERTSGIAHPAMQRRSFLAGAAASALLFKTVFAQTNETDANGPSNKEQLRALLKTLLISESKELKDFAVDVYATCVLGKIRAADPPLAHAWLVPGGGYYAQWLWDTMFVADLLALLPGQVHLLRGVFQNYWDFQQRWNAAKPEPMHGMVANFMAPFDAPGARDGRQWRDVPAYSQAPLLAWGMERVYLRNRDKELLRVGLPALESFHEWYWRERDITNAGLIGVGDYSGDPQHARYETYDREVDLDGLKMVPHPGRAPGVNNGPWYGNLAIPANTAYLILAEQSLERMAKQMGDPAMAARRRARYQKGVQSMQRHMWDAQEGCFVAVNVLTGEQTGSPTIGGFMPMMAHVPTPLQAARMAAVLDTTAWNTPLPIPTVASTNHEYQADEFWRGDVWPAPNYQVATGLALYGYRDAAARIADATVANCLKVGISEHYSSATGAPLGVAGLGMSATTLTMVLDRLTSQRYRVYVREIRG